MGNVYIGIDPAYAKPIAWAKSRGGGGWSYGLADAPGYSSTWDCLVEMGRANKGFVHDNLVTCIESPFASRAAAGLYRMTGAVVMAMLRMWGERVGFVHPTASVWRKVVLADIRLEKGLDKTRKLGVKWKQLAKEQAARLTGEEIESDDVAEAICLAEYARRFASND